MKILKKSLILPILMIFLAIFGVILTNNQISSSAATGTDYLYCSIKSYSNGIIDKTVTFGVNFARFASKEEGEAFMEKLNAKVEEEGKAEFAALQAKQSLPDYDPEIHSKFLLLSLSGDGVVGYGIRYKSLEVYNFYNDEIEITVDENILNTHKEQKIKNPLKNFDTQKYKDMFTQTLGEGEYNPTVYFEYVTSNGRVKSSAAQEEVDEAGLKHFIWFNFAEEDCVLTLNVVHKGWWIFFGITIPLALMFIGIGVVLIKKKVEKKKTKQQPSSAS